VSQSSHLGSARLAPYKTNRVLQTATYKLGSDSVKGGMNVLGSDGVCEGSDGRGGGDIHARSWCRAR